MIAGTANKGTAPATYVLDLDGLEAITDRQANGPRRIVVTN